MLAGLLYDLPLFPTQSEVAMGVGVWDGDQAKTTIKAGGINFDFFKEHTHQEELEFFMNEYGMTRKEALQMIDIPFDEVNIISSVWEVQRAYRVRGGTIIEFQTKTMDVQKKYIDIYNKNIVESR